MKKKYDSTTRLLTTEVYEEYMAEYSDIPRLPEHKQGSLGMRPWQDHRKDQRNSASISHNLFDSCRNGRLHELLVGDPSSGFIGGRGHF